MLKSVDFPWGRGIGTYGFNFTNKRVDFHKNWDGKWIKFVAEWDGSIANMKRRSWYVREKRAWRLYKREDEFGNWHLNVHRPTKRPRPANVGDRAWELRTTDKRLQPWQLLDWYGTQVEVVSFPAPSYDRTTLM